MFIIFDFMKKLYAQLFKLKKELSLARFAVILIGSAILSFGIYNIHQQSGITEGGVIGAMLLVSYWFGFSPSVITFVLDIFCYLLAFKYLGSSFIRISIVSTICVSGFFKLWELVGRIVPDFSAYPLAASILGGIFVGVGCGLIVRQGGSSGGDDALALSISHLSGWRISRAYLFTDVTVLTLSLSYIPFSKIIFSLITVVISSFLIDWIKNMNFSLSGVDLTDK